MKKYGFETIAVQGGYTPDPKTHSRVAPIYMTTAYAFDNVEHARRLFALEEEGNIYTRLQNPTNDIFEKRLAALEGGVGAVATSSGHSAITMALLTLVKNGDEIVSSSTIYGGAINLFDKTFARMGINVKFGNSSDPSSFDKLTTEKTKAYFVEAIGNPKADVADLDGIAEVARKHNVPLIVDNTFATPYLLHPIEHGANIIVHSSTKYLSGSGTVIGGAVVDCGTFKWLDNPRFHEFNNPDPSYHGIIYAEMGNTAYVAKLRTQILRDIGGCQSPFNSWVTLIGLETLALRMQKHSENALAAAKFLKNHPAVESVEYPGLPSSIHYSKAQKYLPKGASAVFTFEIKGGREAGAKFCNSLELLTIVANLGDTRSLVSHPATTTHSQLSEEQLNESGITSSTIRLSIGIEDINDIIDDIAQALDKSQK